MHKGASLPTLCLLCITVPRNGQKNNNIFRDRILKKFALFHNKEGACFTFKMTLFTTKRAPFACFGCWSCGGASAPVQLNSTALIDCAPSGAIRKVQGDNFPVPPSLYCERLNRHKGAPLPTLCPLYITVPRRGGGGICI